MKDLLLFVLIFISFISNAQQVYPLHPSVGDTIDRNEKLDYSLFPKVENNNYASAAIIYQNDTFYLAITSLSDTSTTKKYLSKEDLIEAQKSIEKLNKYYSYLAQKKEDTSSYKSELKSKNLNPCELWMAQWWSK